MTADPRAAYASPEFMDAIRPMPFGLRASQIEAIFRSAMGKALS